MKNSTTYIRTYMIVSSYYNPAYLVNIYLSRAISIYLEHILSTHKLE